MSPSSYYAYKQQPAMGPAQLAEAALVDEIRAIWAESAGTVDDQRNYPVSITENPHPCDSKYQTLGGVLSKLLGERSGSEEREPHR